MKSQQDKVKFIRISVEEGLSQSSAFSIAQDDLGYIWIATFDGLNRYDGYSIKVYKNDKSNPHSVTDNYIQNLCVDDNGYLWIGTNSKGLCWYDDTKDQFNPIPQKSLENENGLEGTSVLSLVKLDKNRIVALTEEGINLIDINTKKCTKISEKDYLKIENSASLISYFNKEVTPEKTINCMLIDASKNVWEGLNEGLVRTKNESYKKIIYKNEIHNSYSLSSNEITCLYEDRGGVIWVGTSLGGVSKWDRHHENLLLYRNNPFNKKTISNSKIRSFYEDSKHRVWIGTVGGGLNLWDKENDSFTFWNKENSSTLISNKIRDIIEWDGKYVIATDGGGIQSFNPDRSNFKFTSIKEIPLDARVWDLHVDGDNLWVSTFNYGLFKLSNSGVQKFEDEIPTEKITWVYSDEKGSVWVATFGLGLFRIDNGEVKSWSKENSDLSDDRIYSIVPDENGNLWLGTKGGVNHFIIKNEKIISYSVKDGLPNGTVMGIAHGDNDDVWLSTNRGVCHFFYKKDSVANYDVKDGLQNNEFLIHSFIELSSGEMIFGGINGFNVFPLQGLSSNKYKPQIVITDFKLSDKSWVIDSIITIKKSLDLAYYQNEFSFEFSALSYTEPLKNQYQYMMEGYDKAWRDNKYRRFVQYTNLPPGKYKFKVKAANNDGLWNDVPASINVIIHPAFWQTLWFKISIVVLVLLLFVVFYKIRTNQIVKKNEWLEGEVAIRTKEIKEKNLMIEEALNDIQSSIQYAKRIQSAILPPIKVVKEFLPNSFILYKPKDIVAGDFYWMENKEGEVLFAAADCTGHGVPGAMVSVVCNNALNRSVREYGLADPGKILDQTREIVIQEFEESDEDVKDGMDIALCAIEGNVLKYAGANNPLWIVRNGEIIETKAEKQPIGKFDHQTPYTTHTFELQQGDTIYIFSDGYVDQFGGEKGKKFKTANFKKLLLSIQHESMEKQHVLIDEMFEKWRGDLEQLDDVCVIGVRV